MATPRLARTLTTLLVFILLAFVTAALLYFAYYTNQIKYSSSITDLVLVLSGAAGVGAVLSLRNLGDDYQYRPYYPQEQTTIRSALDDINLDRVEEMLIKAPPVSPKSNGRRSDRSGT